jgi:uncharacterized membrane protein YidH (DUF202 family)
MNIFDLKSPLSTPWSLLSKKSKKGKDKQEDDESLGEKSYKDMFQRPKRNDVESRLVDSAFESFDVAEGSESTSLLGMNNNNISNANRRGISRRRIFVSDQENFNPMDMSVQNQELSDRNQIKKNVKQDPKVYWANERTLLSWLSVATFLAVSSVSLLSFGAEVPQISGIMFLTYFLLCLQKKKRVGTIMAPIAMLVAIYALGRFHFRQQAIINGKTMNGVVDTWGPWIIVPLVCVMLVLLTVLSFLYPGIAHGH